MEREEVLIKVRDLMTESLVSVELEDSVMKAAKIIDEKGVSSVLVKHGEELSGLVTDRDIISRVVSRGLDPAKVRVSEVMSSPLITISEEASVEEAARKMRENGIRRLVVERNHRKVGIMAESDIIRINPELHFLIRERSKLEARLAPDENQEVSLAGFCEQCGNYSARLRNVNGEWLDKGCAGN